MTGLYSTFPLPYAHPIGLYGYLSLVDAKILYEMLGTGLQGGELSPYSLEATSKACRPNSTLYKKNTPVAGVFFCVVYK
jgi:hypothetical protein